MWKCCKSSAHYCRVGSSLNASPSVILCENSNFLKCGSIESIGYDAKTGKNLGFHTVCRCGGRGTQRRKGTKAGIQATHAPRLRLILARLHASTGPHDMNLPGLELYQLRGPRKGTWAVKVRSGASC